MLVVFGYKIALNKTLESFFPRRVKDRKLRQFGGPRPNHSYKMRSSNHLSLTRKEISLIIAALLTHKFLMGLAR
jgi:hypothetical protein